MKEEIKLLNDRCGIPSPIFDKLFISADIVFRCGECGHYDDLLNFSKTEINGDLPHDIFQCPKCQTAIKRYYNNGAKHKKIVTIM